MAANVTTLVCPIHPVVVAVIVGLRFARDNRAGGSCSYAVRLDVVDEHHHVLRIGSSGFGRWLGKWHLLVLFPTDHDEAAAEHELGVLNSSAFAFDFELNLESERAKRSIRCRPGGALSRALIYATFLGVTLH